MKIILSNIFHYWPSKSTTDQKITAEKVFQEINRRRGLCSYKTVDNELTAFRSFQKFMGTSVNLNRLTADDIKKYEHALKENGICPNTSACYMRSLRAVFNRLGLDGNTLFKQVKTTKDKATKKAVGQESLQKIQDADLTENEARARDMFILSIMAMGIAFVDLVNLRKTDMKDGYITYHRHKTGKRVKVKVEPCMLQIINKYRDSQSVYLLPLLTETDPDKKTREYYRLLGKYNHALKKISKSCGLQTTISSYTARHTWASIAYEKGTPLSAISKALGHTSAVTTQNYLKEIDDEGLFKANLALIQGIFT